MLSVRSEAYSVGMLCHNKLVTHLRSTKNKGAGKKYSTELKEKVVKIHLSEGGSMASLKKEYNLLKGCVSNWVKSYSKE